MCNQLPLQQGAYVLRISVIQSLLLRWVINIVLIYIIARYTCIGIFADIVYWPTNILFFYHDLFKNVTELFFYQKYWICSFVVFLSTSFLLRQRNPLPLILYHKQQVQKPSDHWKTEYYWGLSDCCEIYLDSDLNFLASSNLWQYTTVPIQCEWLPWTWMWHLLYFYRWYNFEKHPGSV